MLLQPGRCNEGLAGTALTSLLVQMNQTFPKKTFFFFLLEPKLRVLGHLQSAGGGCARFSLVIEKIQRGCGRSGALAKQKCLRMPIITPESRILTVCWVPLDTVPASPGARGA